MSSRKAELEAEFQKRGIPIPQAPAGGGGNNKDARKKELEAEFQKRGMPIPQNPAHGWSGVGRDVTQSVEELPEDIAHLAKTLPGEAHSELHGATGQALWEPSRIAKNYLAGTAEFGRDVLNAPNTFSNYLIKKGFIPKEQGIKERLPDYKYHEMLGVEGEKPGDRIMRGLARNMPALFMGELGAAGGLLRTGQRALSMGGNAAIQNENPVKAALMTAVPELGGKVIAKTVGTTYKHTVPPLINEGKKIFGNKAAVAKDVMGGLLPEEVAPALQRASEAKKMGVNLTPAEASGSKILAAKEGKLGTSPEGEQNYHRFKKEQKVAQQESIDKLMNDVTNKPEVAGGAIKNTAETIIEKQSKALQEKAKPIYEEAYKENVSNNQLNAFLKDSNIHNAYERVMKSKLYESEIHGHHPTSLKVLDQVKRVMDDDIKVALKAGKNNDARIIGIARKKLVEGLDKVSPAYSEARNVYSEGAKPLEELKNSELGKIANTNDVNVKNISKTIFDANQTDPRVLAKLRDAFKQENPQAWDRIIHNEMERRITSGQAGTSRNPGSNFHKNILANEQSFKQFKEALKGNPVAQEKLTMMRDVFRDLINEPSVNAAHGAPKIPTSVPEAIKEIYTKVTKGKYDKAAVELITSGKWDQYFLPTLKEAPKTRMAKTLKLLERINNSREAQAAKKGTKEFGKAAFRSEAVSHKKEERR
jgi:hypothetical protein